METEGRIDRITQLWVRLSGREVSFEECPWLRGPVGNPARIADEWLRQEAERQGAVMTEGVGLLTDMATLAGGGFNPLQLAAPVINFYENTLDWSMEVTHKWSPVALPIGRLLSALFTRRIQQLNFPLKSSDTAHRMDSRLTSLMTKDGVQLGVAWMRTLPSTGQYVYSGWYGTTNLPGSARPSLRVVFPLPNGSVIVFLRPEIGDDGSLILVSPLGAFGDAGAYLVVARPDQSSGWVRRVPIVERFVVRSADEKTLFTDHALSLWHLPIIRFHYRLRRGSIGPNETATSATMT